MIPDVHSEYQNIGAARMGVHQVNAVGIRFAVVDLGTYSYNMTQPIIGRLLRSRSWTDLLQKGWETEEQLQKLLDLGHNYILVGLKKAFPKYVSNLKTLFPGLHFVWVEDGPPGQTKHGAKSPNSRAYLPDLKLCQQYLKLQPYYEPQNETENIITVGTGIGNGSSEASSSSVESSNQPPTTCSSLAHFLNSDNAEQEGFTHRIVSREEMGESKDAVAVLFESIFRLGANFISLEDALESGEMETEIIHDGTFPIPMPLVFHKLPRRLPGGKTASNSVLEQTFPFLPSSLLYGNDDYESKKKVVIQALISSRDVVLGAPVEADSALQEGGDLLGEAFREMKPENSIVISEDGDATALTNFQWYGRFQKPKDGSKFQLVNLFECRDALGINQAQNQGTLAAVGRDGQRSFDGIGLKTARKLERYRREFHGDWNFEEALEKLTADYGAKSGKKRGNDGKGFEQALELEKEKGRKEIEEMRRYQKNWLRNLPDLKRMLGLPSTDADTEMPEFGGEDYSNLRSLYNTCSPESSEALIGIAACMPNLPPLEELESSFSQLVVFNTSVQEPADLSAFVQMNIKTNSRVFYEPQPQESKVDRNLHHSTSSNTHAGAAGVIEGPLPPIEQEEPQRGRGAAGPATFTQELTEEAQKEREQANADAAADAAGGPGSFRRQNGLESIKKIVIKPSKPDSGGKRKKSKLSSQEVPEGSNSIPGTAEAHAPGPSTSRVRSASPSKPESNRKKAKKTDKMPSRSSRNVPATLSPEQVEQNKKLAEAGLRNRGFKANGDAIITPKTPTEKLKSVLGKTSQFVSRNKLLVQVLNPSLQRFAGLLGLLMNSQRLIHGHVISLLSLILRKALTTYPNYQDWLGILQSNGDFYAVNLEVAVRQLLLLIPKGSASLQPLDGDGDVIMEAPDTAAPVIESGEGEAVTIGTSAGTATAAAGPGAASTPLSKQEKAEAKKEKAAKEKEKLLAMAGAVINQTGVEFPPMRFTLGLIRLDFQRVVFSLRAYFVQSFFRQVKNAISLMARLKDPNARRALASLSSIEGNDLKKVDSLWNSILPIALTRGNVAAFQAQFSKVADNHVLIDDEGNSAEDADSEALVQELNKQVAEPQAYQSAQISSTSSLKESIKSRIRKGNLKVNFEAHLPKLGLELIAKSIQDFDLHIWNPIVDKLRSLDPKVKKDLSPIQLAASDKKDQVFYASQSIAIAPLQYSNEIDLSDTPSRSATATERRDTAFTNDGKPLAPEETVARCTIPLGSSEPSLFATQAIQEIEQNGKWLCEFLIPKPPSVRSFLHAVSFDVDVDETMEALSGRRQALQVPSKEDSVFGNPQLWETSPLDHLKKVANGETVSIKAIKIKGSVKEELKDYLSSALLVARIFTDLGGVPDDQLLSPEMRTGRKQFESTLGEGQVAQRVEKMAWYQLFRGVVKPKGRQQSVIRGVFSGSLSPDVYITHVTFHGLSVEFTGWSLSKLQGPAPILPASEPRPTIESYFADPDFPELRSALEHYLKQLPTEKHSIVKEKEISFAEAPPTSKSHEAIEAELKQFKVDGRTLDEETRKLILVYVRHDDYKRSLHFKRAMTESGMSREGDAVKEKLASIKALVKDICYQWRQAQGNSTIPKAAKGRIAAADHASRAVLRLYEGVSVIFDPGTHGSHALVIIILPNGGVFYKSINIHFRTMLNRSRKQSREIQHFNSTLTSKFKQSIQMEGAASDLNQIVYQSQKVNGFKGLDSTGRHRGVRSQWLSGVVNDVFRAAGLPPGNVKPPPGTDRLSIFVGNGDWSRSISRAGHQPGRYWPLILKDLIGLDRAAEVLSIDENLSSKLASRPIANEDEMLKSGSKYSFAPAERDSVTNKLVRPPRHQMKDRKGAEMNKLQWESIKVWDGARFQDAKDIGDRDIKACFNLFQVLQHLKEFGVVPHAHYGVED